MVVNRCYARRAPAATSFIPDIRGHAPKCILWTNGAASLFKARADSLKTLATSRPGEDVFPSGRAPLRVYSLAMGISPEQFARMQQRLAGRAAKKPAAPNVVPVSFATHSVILGIDPSLRGTGFGVIRIEKPTSATLAHGTISIPPAWEHSRCLVKIHQTLRDVIAEHQPTCCVMEGLFHSRNLKTAIVMGQARGAAIVAAAEAGLEIYEIAPRKMKQAIVGYGAAQKSAVASMVQRMLNLLETPAPDAADALALALAYAQGANRYSLAQPRRV